MRRPSQTSLNLNSGNLCCDDKRKPISAVTVRT